MLVTRAPAKINWTLEVLGRRPDGYHEIASVLSTISLCDVLTLTPANEWSVTVDAPEPLRSGLDTADNLVHRAIDQLLGAVREPLPAAQIRLEKHVPVAAGLGGGSSDAAAALRLVTAYWARSTGSPVASIRGELGRLAAAIGSDVPFFLRGGTQLVSGRGEIARPLPSPRAPALVLLAPPISIEHKTARLYAMLRPEHFTNGTRSIALADGLSRGRPATIVQPDVVNVFEAVAEQAFPGIGAYRRLLYSVAGSHAYLCGAGPSLVAVARDRPDARRAARALQRRGLRAWAVDVLSHGEASAVFGAPNGEPHGHPNRSGRGPAASATRSSGWRYRSRLRSPAARWHRRR